MTVDSGQRLNAAAVPRGLLLARAWARLGPAVAPLSNATGRPLARTVRLIIDPLVLRPVRNPRFAGGTVAAEHAEDLCRRIVDAGPVLAATAAWFVLVKQARRRAGITEGNPQDLYFQRCYELAVEHGQPGADAAGTAAATLREVHEPTRLTVRELRRFLTDPANTAELARRLRAAWADRPNAPAGPDGRDDAVADFLATCPSAPDPALFAGLVADRVGAADAAALERPDIARDYGLSDRTRLAPPVLGDTASKASLPKPLDRSILERLFAGTGSAFHRETMADPPTLVLAEIDRSARPWQLAEEPHRVALVLGRFASAELSAPAAPASTGAAGRLRSRWRREAYVHRVSRMPAVDAPAVPPDLRADIDAVHRPYLRRLWVRLHGRELRQEEELVAAAVWDLLDGVLRSVVMDQRDRLRAALERCAAVGQ